MIKLTVEIISIVSKLYVYCENDSNSDNYNEISYVTSMMITVIIILLAYLPV
jgi:hypothetical protein